jgi:uncharacterized phage protein gp47/JayE
MPWQTPTLDQLRAQNRDNITAQLRSGPIVPNSNARVMADANAGLAYLTLLYLDWLALQLMPDTAETEWLDRFGNIWVGGRKTATYAIMTALVAGLPSTPVPSGTILTAAGNNGTIELQTTAAVMAGPVATPVSVVAVTSGKTSIEAGAALTPTLAIAGLSSIVVSTITDGIDEETDDELRIRVLDRIRQPPMGGDAFDYVQWALSFPGVTRAWCSPLEMGIGTVTLRFMMDDVRASAIPAMNGFPYDTDVLALQSYLDSLRPVAVKDFFVEAPIPEPIDFTLKGLSDSSSSTIANIAASVSAMLAIKAAPASSLNGVPQPPPIIYAAWVSDAVLTSSGVDYFDLVMQDHIMRNNGSLAVLGNITVL